MYNKEMHSFCSEFYTLAQSVTIVMKWQVEATTIRVDVLKKETADKPKYVSRAFRQEEVTLQPSYPEENGKLTSKPTRYEVWVTHETPWVDGSTAEQALSQTLGFLREQCG